MEELSPQSLGYEVIRLEPGEIDDDWCAMVSEVYKEGEFRLVLQSPYYFEKTSRPHSHKFSFNMVNLDYLDSDGLLIDGVLLGARMLPDIQQLHNQNLKSDFIPHAIFTDVLTLAATKEGEPTRLTEPNQKIYVPLISNGFSVTLYNPQNLVEHNL